MNEFKIVASKYLSVRETNRFGSCRGCCFKFNLIATKQSNEQDKQFAREAASQQEKLRQAVGNQKILFAEAGI